MITEGPPLSLSKTTTLPISDYKFLSILPPRERLNYNKGVLMHKIMSKKVLPSLTAIFPRNQSRHSRKLNMPIPRTDLFKSSLVYSDSVLWNWLDSLRLPSNTKTFKSRYMYALNCSHCMLNLVIVTRLQRSNIGLLCLPFITHFSTK